MFRIKSNGRHIALVLMLAFVFCFATVSIASAAPYTIGLYKDAGILHGGGVWEDGRKAIVNFADAKGYTVKDITAADINDNSAFDGSKGDTIRILWMPGGNAYPYKCDISPNGVTNIKAFLSNGGKMIGICAGEYYMATQIDWKGENYPYTGIFQGKVTGPNNSIAVYDRDGVYNYAWANITLDESNPINSGLGGSLQMPYYGGGYIPPAPDNTQSVATVGTFAINTQKGIATFKYNGRGTCLFMGPHPEMGLASNGSGGGTWYTNGTHGAQWIWLKKAVDWVLNN